MSSALGQPAGTAVPEADILTIDEEGALSSLRDIVADIRAMGLAPGVGNVGDAIVAAGGTALQAIDDREAGTFTLGGARFTLRPVPGAEGKIEVSFLPIG